MTLEVHEHYQKRTWRNKTAILGPDKPLFLTVPLCKGKHQQLMIRDVRISNDEPWQKIHLNSIKTAYGKTAFYEEIVEDLQQLYHHTPETLWELNQNFMYLITSLLHGEWKIIKTESYVPTYPASVIDLRKGVPAGSTHLQTEPGIDYEQVHRLHKPHQPNLSILDALCHLGPETGQYLGLYAEKLYEKPIS